MSTLFKRIFFILILLWIAYGIYWLIDRKGADELKENIVTTTQETVETFKSINDDTLSNSEETLGNISEVIAEQNIVVTDPEIQEPVVIQTTKTTTTTKPKSTSSSSNILFDLFK